jgi:DNA-binding beta-propeller fold protein YncE
MSGYEGIVPMVDVLAFLENSGVSTGMPGLGRPVLGGFMMPPPKPEVTAMLKVTIRDWAKPPGGVPWAAVTAVEVAPDGSIYVIHRCHDNSCAGRPEPPILKFDASGKLLKAWGEGMFVFPHGVTVDAQGNLRVTDEQGKDGKGQQVFKFSPEGKVLMTLGKAGVASDAPGLFDQPTDVAIADIFVTEGHLQGNNRISKFSSDGAFIKSWGHKGSCCVFRRCEWTIPTR